MRSVKVQWVMGFNQKQWLSEEVFKIIIPIQTYNWTKYALCESPVSGGLQAEARARIRIFSKNYTHSNIQLNKLCALWKCTEWRAWSRSNDSQKKIFKTLYTFKHTTEQSLRSVEVHWVVGFKQKQWLSGEVFQNIIPIQTYNWTMYALCEYTLSGGLQAEAMARWRYFSKNIYAFKHTIEQIMRSVKVHWVLGLKQKQWLAEEVFQNVLHIQTYNWTKYALCECTVSGGLQAEAMARIRNFSKKIYTFKHTIEQIMRSVKVHWVKGLKQKQWLAEEVFQNFIHIQTYNWTNYALCECTVSGGLQAEAMAFRRNFSKHYKHSNIQLNKLCALWKYTDCWDSSRSNG